MDWEKRLLRPKEVLWCPPRKLVVITRESLNVTWGSNKFSIGEGI
jgi:hypothetical protein